MNNRTVTFIILAVVVADMRCNAEQVALTIPLKIEGENRLESPVSLILESEDLELAFDASTPPDDSGSVRAVCWGIIDAAKKGDLDAFVELSVPGLEPDILARDFGIYESVVGNEAVTFERAFFVGDVCVITARVGAGKTVGGFIMLQELEDGTFAQNVALAYGNVPQAIQYAINLGNTVSAPAEGVDSRAVVIELENDASPVNMILNGVYAANVALDESAFDERYGITSTTIVDDYFGKFSSIGTKRYEPENFGAASQAKIGESGGVKRWIPSDRRDLVCTVSPTEFLILSLDWATKELHYGYLVLGANGESRLVNLQLRTPVERLLELPPTAQALASYFERAEQQLALDVIPSEMASESVVSSQSVVSRSLILVLTILALATILGTAFIVWRKAQ